MHHFSKTVLWATLPLLVLSGCGTLDTGTKKGAAVGAATGALLGGIIGHQDDEHGWEGALIGGAAGAAGGALIGHQMDKRQVQTNPEHLTIDDIARMGRNGVPEETIISQIKITRSRYRLDSKTISYLKNNNVSNRVIDVMLETSGN